MSKTVSNSFNSMVSKKKFIRKLIFFDRQLMTLMMSTHFDLRINSM